MLRHGSVLPRFHPLGAALQPILVELQPRAIFKDLAFDGAVEHRVMLVQHIDPAGPGAFLFEEELLQLVIGVLPTIEADYIGGRPVEVE
jgi:hypothetical protein